MEEKIAVFGNTDFVMPFSALGLDTFAVSGNREQIVEIAGKIIDGDYALVVVAENIAEAAQDVFSSRMNSPTPCIVVVPFTTEPQGFATKDLEKVLKMATGINILNE